MFFFHTGSKKWRATDDLGCGVIHRKRRLTFCPFILFLIFLKAAAAGCEQRERERESARAPAAGNLIF
jgi:hypothetical protein